MTASPKVPKKGKKPGAVVVAEDPQGILCGPGAARGIARNVPPVTLPDKKAAEAAVRSAAIDLAVADAQKKCDKGRCEGDGMRCTFVPREQEIVIQSTPSRAPNGGILWTAQVTRARISGVCLCQVGEPVGPGEDGDGKPKLPCGPRRVEAEGESETIEDPSRQKALDRAIDQARSDARRAARRSCGGGCEDGQACTYVETDLTIKRPKITRLDKSTGVVFRVTARAVSIGACQCVDGC